MRQDLESGYAPDTVPFVAPAAIQPHGVLLAIDDADRIASLAGATEKVFGRAAPDLLGRPWVRTSEAPDRPMPAIPPDLSARPRHLGTWLARDRCRWDVSAHRSGTCTLLEFEPAATGPSDAAAAVTDIRRACALFESCADVHAICAACTKAIGGLSGFDRVAVQRFACGDGLEVATTGGATSTSRPSPVSVPSVPFCAAERTYAVPDLARLPVPVPSMQDGKIPDIAHCVLRDVGTAQREYLTSLGVAASLWLPIVVRGRLWGAVACHHDTPRPIPCTLRLACELVVRECALRIEACGPEERRQPADGHMPREQAGLLVQEANHRVQNSLHIVASMLRLQARQARLADVRTELETAAGRLAAIGAVHRQLSRPGDARDVRLDVYLGQLCRDLACSWGDAWAEQLTVDACATALAADSAISLGLVVTELLTNAAKYAYRGAPGPIGVHAATHGPWLHVTVSDRGCGMRSDVAGTGLGSRLNRLFVAQLGGDIQVDSGDDGTIATVRMPRAQPRQDDPPATAIEPCTD